MKKVIIRKAKASDLCSILELNFDLFKKEWKEFDNSLDLKWTYGHKGKDYFDRRVIQKSGLTLVAEKENEIIGYLCGGFRKHSARIKAKYAQLENMIVAKKFRGKGIGTKLAKEFFKWCQSNKADYISVTASAKNILGINFYRNIGFKDYNLTLEIKCKK
jgi:ribosomal protein S18 acetylase RimI-like enzyme